MFKKILIANRGEIGVRIVRTCREMGIGTVALYTLEDRSSLHVRLADECVQLNSASDFVDPEMILDIALTKGADAIHPGYGFLAEEAEFVRACDGAGITFIGPSADIVESLRDKIAAQKKARAAGIPTLIHSDESYGEEEFDILETAASEIGYPVIIKSCSGGRGRGERLAKSPKYLREAVRQAVAVGKAVYGNKRVYLEKAVLPAFQVGVQIMADKKGNVIHLGEREGSILQKGQKIVEEAPANCLDDTQRKKLWQTSLEIARLFNYENIGTVEFIVDGSGKFYFSEVKARLQVEHPLTEKVTRVDLVREQIRIAAGETLSLTQEEVWLGGSAMMCRIRANDPWHNFMPSPGELKRVRLPSGPEVRVDTYVYCQCNVPGAFDPLIAKLTVWAKDREMCRRRMQRALEDFTIIGTPTNLPVLQNIVASPEFRSGNYSTQYQIKLFDKSIGAEPDSHLRDLAVAAAISYVRRNQLFNPKASERLQGGWHQSSRRLPQ